MTDGRSAEESAVARDPLHGLGRNAAWQVAALLVPGLYSVLLVAFLLRTLGPAGYAPWAAAAAIIGWLALLDAGLSATTTRDAARAIAGDPDAIRRIAAANAAYALLGVAAVALGAVASTAIPVLLRLTGAAAVEAWLVGAFLTLDLAIVVATAGWVGVVRGARRFDLLLVVNVVQVALAGVLLVFLVPALGLAGAAAAQPISRLVSRALLGLVLRARIPWYRPMPQWPGWPRLRSVLAFSLPILAMQAAAQIGMGTDVVIVGAAAGATAVGLYAAGSQLVRYVGLLLFPALGVLLPTFATIAYERPQAMAESLRRALFLGGLLGAMVFGGMALQARELAVAWSAQASTITVNVLTLYAVAWMLVTPAQVFVLALIARGRHALVGAIILVEALANLVLSIALVMQLGPPGVAVATLIAVAIDDIVVIPAVAAKLLGVRWTHVVLATAAGLATGGTLIALVNLVPVGGTGGLVVRALLGGSALLVALWATFAARRLQVLGRAHP